MVFYILTSIVFIAEIIIFAAVMFYLFKLNRCFSDCNSLITELRPKIVDLLKIGSKISEQLVELTPVFIQKIKSAILYLLLERAKDIFMVFAIWYVKKQVQRFINKKHSPST